MAEQEPRTRHSAEISAASTGQDYSFFLERAAEHFGRELASKNAGAYEIEATDSSFTRDSTIERGMQSMTNRVEKLKAELEALILWDRLFTEDPAPERIDKDACFARIFRRVQVIAELHELTSRN